MVRHPIPGLLALGCFGSYARGDHGVGSDPDLLLVVESSLATGPKPAPGGASRACGGLGLYPGRVAGPVRKKPPLCRDPQAGGAPAPSPPRPYPVPKRFGLPR
ncbi:nucleotidyltransferase domain-containing protein [Thermus tenuipuniceus]|uniref:nucleotidyltransferase domain-containing protein n=1 Tax=Thermus tenuipuniceus TaxID=2078690 RepID=UPI003CC62CC2